MTTFDESKHNRDRSGQFTHKSHPESDAPLTGLNIHHPDTPEQVPPPPLPPRIMETAEKGVSRKLYNQAVKWVSSLPQDQQRAIAKSPATPDAVLVVLSNAPMGGNVTLAATRNLQRREREHPPVPTPPPADGGLAHHPDEAEPTPPPPLPPDLTGTPRTQRAKRRYMRRAHKWVNSLPMNQQRAIAKSPTTPDAMLVALQGHHHGDIYMAADANLERRRQRREVLARQSPPLPPPQP